MHIWDTDSMRAKGSHYLVYQLDSKVTACYPPLSMSCTENHWKSERLEESWPYGQNLIKTPTTNRKLMIAVGGMLERGGRGVEHVGRRHPNVWVTIGTTKNNIKQITPRPKTAANWWGYTQQPTRNRHAWRRWYRRGGLTGDDRLGGVMPSFWGQ